MLATASANAVLLFVALRSTCWLRRNGVNTNGVAAKVMSFDRFREKGTPCHFWEDKSRLTGVPKKSLLKKHEIYSDPVSADPICPFPNPPRASLQSRSGPAAAPPSCLASDYVLRVATVLLLLMSVVFVAHCCVVSLFVVSCLASDSAPSRRMARVSTEGPRGVRVCGLYPSPNPCKQTRPLTAAAGLTALSPKSVCVCDAHHRADHCVSTNAVLFFVALRVPHKLVYTSRFVRAILEQGPC